MTKKVRFGGTKFREMSIDLDSHIQEIKDPFHTKSFIVDPSKRRTHQEVPHQPVEPSSKAQRASISWWWILLAIIIVCILCYFLFRK